MLKRTRATKARFQLILIKPSHYDNDGYVVQWIRSTMPSNSLAAVYSLARGAADRQVLGPDLPIDVIAIDETNTRVRPRDIAKRIARNGGLGLVGLIGVGSIVGLGDLVQPEQHLYHLLHLLFVGAAIT